MEEKGDSSDFELGEDGCGCQMNCWSESFAALLSCWDFHHIKAICRLYLERTRGKYAGKHSCVEGKSLADVWGQRSESAQHTKNSMLRH